MAKKQTTERTLTDIAIGAVTVLSLLWLGKKMDKKFYRLVGKRHRFDYRTKEEKRARINY
jgi:hypothetical protein